LRIAQSRQPVKITRLHWPLDRNLSRQRHPDAGQPRNKQKDSGNKQKGSGSKPKGSKKK
jgi:hypothetical protein